MPSCDMHEKNLSVGHRQLRIGRVSIPGQIYFITVVCKNRERRFIDFNIASAICRKISDSSTWADATLIAWVLMPDYFHLLLQLGEKTSLQAVMKRANMLLAMTANRLSRRKGQVWQSAYFDHALRREEYVESVARYMIANPVRAGLVADIGLYPFWDVAWLCNEDGIVF
jgi:putative transposase